MAEIDIKMFEVGLKGEKVLREYLKKLKNCTFGQIDIISKIHDKWYLFEVKHQEKFNAPPFDGHGLPIWQVKFRIKVYKELGVIPILFILDKKTGIMYYQSILELERIANKLGVNKGYFITGKQSRKIYPISSFKILQQFI